MFRVLHRWAGVIGSLILIVVSLTGFVLSIFPVLSADRTAARLDAGALVAAVQQAVPGVEQILVEDNNRVSAVAFGADGFQQLAIDPATGASLGPVQQGAVELWFENLHRALFLSDTGHIVVLVASGMMLALVLSGYVLAARRMGGWRKLFARDRGDGAGGWHLKIARIAGVGLLISTLSGLWMGASTLGLIPETTPYPDWPVAISTEAPVAADQLGALTAIPGTELRAVTLPRDGMTGQAYLVETDGGAGYVDPVTGQMLTWDARSGWSHVMDMMHLLHTGQGASLLGLLLGLMSLSVPVLSGTGVLIWLKGRGSREVPSSPPDKAEVILLVGSETGTTWRCANAFARVLVQAGRSVHLARMSAFAPERYTQARAVIAFAATYGEGDAPEGAKGFLDRLAALDRAPTAPLSVLGFGDTSYPQFCAYAHRVTLAARQAGWPLALDTFTVDRQCPADFTAWSAAWAEAAGLDLPNPALSLDARPMQELRLISGRTYGEQAQAPMAVLRFALPRRTLLDRLTGRGFGAFEAGDILNVLPEGSDLPRAYSLASSNRDGFVEICVRKQPGGLCSTQLCALEEGETIRAQLSVNAGFHADRGKAPLVLIGAGAGIGALAGIVRGNRQHRPIHLFFGLRSGDGGYPYDASFEEWQTDGRLGGLTLAVSRGRTPRYVQQALSDEADRLRTLAQQGARFMICGGREMGEGVRAALDDLLAPVALSVQQLKEEGRYAVDVF
ncbi:PepSY domain-containing protein [Sagittula sp. S175]|uniref:PepSY domain-containing protein n=1 Tax=Sagittula sp. S175 TaxID=3415129 RepID=UPI003C7C4E78